VSLRSWSNPTFGAIEFGRESEYENPARQARELDDATVASVLLPAFGKVPSEQRRLLLDVVFPLVFRLATLLGGADQGAARPARPDCWGRYLVAGREISFQLEWDCGTERLAVLAAKATEYEDFYAERPGGEFNHLLWVADSEPRERQLRRALEQAGADSRHLQHWTSSAELLAERGHLEPLWWHLRGGERLALPELSGRVVPGRDLEACLGKPGWWNRRPASMWALL
jgi:hypothetical protein